ncbi:hypothetical protein SARC_01671 [Sphaeroforma arctica JP610]|uniref:Nuclear pore complex protein Nup153 n=1 Tax=Sphaeroforma arctica JP610 TaxID=667725 RepID=A0A0L0GBB6_9EUKA|nr:hypothetical protein SARC_01671 [Sphaeroforma arctica JP610]KNC86194.1 hypothetical protein SARC_01671 [Sphaeroforma arctica JP610]|eukprot:XP_014160096.1 hypothetical protein SARC_01671 [Sphaeroforma arctica JP610]
MPPKRRAEEEAVATPSRRSGRVRNQSNQTPAAEPQAKRERKTLATAPKPKASKIKAQPKKTQAKIDPPASVDDTLDNDVVKSIDSTTLDGPAAADAKDSGTKTAETKPAGSSLWADWGKKTDTWTCNACGVMNDNKIEECPACTTSRHAKAQPAAKPSVVPEPKVAPPAIDSTAPVASLWANWGKKEGAWTCPACAVNNIDKSKDKCPACETQNPAATFSTTAATKVQTPATFSFGVAPASIAAPVSFGVPSSASTGSTATPVTFGIPSSTTTSKAAAPISFGVPPSTSTSTEDPKSTTKDGGGDKPKISFGRAP